MLNLLRSDLYRITRIRGLRGHLWQYASVLLFIACLVVGLTWLIIQSGMGPEEGVDIIESLATPSAFLGKTMLGSFSVLALASSFGMAEYTFADLSDGYIKSLVSSSHGRIAYLGEKIVFAGIWTALMLALGCILNLLVLQVFLSMSQGFTIQSPDDPAALLLWLFGAWLASWAITVIAMVAVPLFRKKLPVYIFTFTLVGGFIPLLLHILSVLPNSMLPLLKSIAPALSALAMWMPSTVLQSFMSGADAVFDTVATLPLAGDVAAWVWAALTGILWLFIGAVAYLVIGKRRDL